MALIDDLRAERRAKAKVKTTPIVKNDIKAKFDEVDDSLLLTIIAKQPTRNKLMANSSIDINLRTLILRYGRLEV